MTEKDTGGPAFPHDDLNINSALVRASSGMTLRDYFAAKAMQGELSAQSVETGFYPDDAFPTLASRAYLLADAMLQARKVAP